MRRWLGVSTVVVGLCSAGTAASTVALSFDPDPRVMLVDEEADIAVAVDAAGIDLKTFDISFTYDSTILQILSVTAGTLLTDTGAPLFFDTDEVDDTVRVVASVLGPGVSFDGPGEVIRFRVKALAPGFAIQTFHRRVLIDVAGAQPDNTADPGLIEVHTPSTAVDGAKRVLSIRAAASPTQGGGAVEYAVPEGRTATLRWYDARGRTLGERRALAGAGRLELELPGAGIYWAEIRAGESVRRTRLVVLP
jgi:hypothetical protein